MALESTLHRVFCQRLRKFRKDAGLTQAQMGERMGITQAAYSDLENGRFCPSIAVLEKAAVALGKRPDEMIGEEKVSAVA